MDSRTLWLTILGMGAITYGLRIAMISLLGRIEIPPLIGRALRFVPPAVLSAIILPDVVITDGALNVSFGNTRLLAAAVAAVVAWRVKNAFATVGAGLVTLWLLQAVR